MLRRTDPLRSSPLSDSPQGDSPRKTRSGPGLGSGLAARAGLLLCSLAAPAAIATTVLGSSLLAPRAAQAQTAVQSAAVLDFTVNAGLDPILGRKAADAIAVELQRSGDFEIITRQQLEAAIATQPGLRPPYTQATQARLAGVVGARSVFSGRVLRTVVNNGRSARVFIEVRQLDVITSDYINGTQISEITDEKLQQFDNDVLIDESINKAAFAAVRSMKQTTLPVGTVLNVTNEEIETNIGTRNGAAVGQRYSVLRDNLNRARNITERVKVGEITLTSVEDNQSTARVSAGGQAGVRTQDRLRQIYVPSNFPVSGVGSSPVTSPPPSNRRGRGFLGGLGQSILGIGALGALIAFGGFGGGSSGTANEAPGGVVAIPTQTSITTTDAFAGVPLGGSAIRVTFRDGLPSIIRGQNVAGYLIFRSTSPAFSASSGTLIDFTRSSQTTYVDDTSVLPTRTIAVTGGTSTTTGATGGGGGITVTETTGAAAANSITQAANAITVIVTRPPIQPGVQYFYRVARILGATVTTTGNGNGQGGQGGTTTTTTTTLQPVLSQTSASSGGATAIPTVTIDPATAPTSLSNFVLRLPISLIGANIDTARLEVSIDRNFPANNTFVQIFRNPPTTAGTPGTPAVPAVGTTPAIPAVPGTAGQITINAGSIIVPGYDPASGNPVFVRVGLSASDDSPGNVVYSRTLALNDVTTTTSALLGGRSMNSAGAMRRRGGLGGGVGGGVGGATGRSTGRGRGFILRPR